MNTFTRGIGLGVGGFVGCLLIAVGLPVAALAAIMVFLIILGSLPK